MNPRAQELGEVHAARVLLWRPSTGVGCCWPNVVGIHRMLLFCLASLRHNPLKPPLYAGFSVFSLRVTTTRLRRVRSDALQQTAAVNRLACFWLLG